MRHLVVIVLWPLVSRVGIVAGWPDVTAGDLTALGMMPRLTVPVPLLMVG